MTSCGQDATTAVRIFGHRDYGIPPPGSTVLDIGANFGALAVLAARNGAHVVAVEPNGECFAALTLNAGHGDIRPIRAAAWSRSGEYLPIPKRPHPGNSVLWQWTTGIEPDLVEGRSLEDLADGLDRIDVLKMDCEGAEYPILRATPDKFWPRVQALVMEYHDGGETEIAAILQRAGLRSTSWKRWRVWGKDYGLIHANRDR